MNRGSRYYLSFDLMFLVSFDGEGFSIFLFFLTIYSYNSMLLLKRLAVSPLLSTTRLLLVTNRAMSTQSTVYFGCVKVAFQEGSRDECVKGFEATMGKFYRQQPGHILYMFGACAQDPNAVLGFHVWSDRSLFDSLPKDPEDLKKLSASRQA